MKSPLLILSFLLLLFSCTKENSLKERNIYQIVSLLVDDFGRPFIPPPPPNEINTYTDIQLDSIFNQKQKISIYPVFQKVNNKFSHKKAYDVEFNKLMDSLKDVYFDKKVDISKIKINRPFNLSIIDTIKVRQDRRYLEENFDKLLSFYNISFNEKQTKAVTIIGVGMGTLNGYTSLVFLEKINGKWKIKGVDTFSIS